MINGNIGEVLKAGRERAGLKQDELAYRLGYDRTLISKVETGAIPQPSYALVKQWAKICKCEDLISFDIAGDKSGWKELLNLQSKLNKAKEILSMMRVKRGGKEKQNANANG